MRLQEFVGNQKVVDLLKRGGIPQTTLLAGPEGVGKRTLALSLAALANCKDPQEGDLCLNCSSCVKSRAGQHPDIVLFQPEKNLIRIEPMRGLNREVQFLPFEGRLRFFVIDRAETLTEEAANAILKTIEEPPPTSRIILVSAFPDRLLPTIRSRCQVFTFRPLDPATIQNYLERHGTVHEAGMRARLARGSIGLALELPLEETLAERDQMLDLLVSWQRKRSFEELFGRLEKAPLRTQLRSREHVRRYLELLQQLGEDLYFLLVGTPPRVVHQDRMDDLQKLAAGLELKWLWSFLYHVEQSLWEVDHYVSPLMCFETLWLLSDRKVDARNRYRPF